MQRKSFKSERCPVARTLDVVGEWWTLLILRDAFSGLTRFSEFQQSLGMARNVLSARLKKLTENQILQMRPASDGSAYQEYVLTEKGRSLFIIVTALRQWGEAHLLEPGEVDLKLVDRKSGRPVKMLELRSQSGRLLSLDDLQLVNLKQG